MMCSRDSSICAVPMLSLSPWVCCKKTCIHAHDELLSMEVREWTKLGPNVVLTTDCGELGTNVVRTMPSIASCERD